MIDELPAEWLTAIDRGKHIPSLAYRVAMIANADLDATFVKSNAHDWDLAAADLILHEAGGKLVNAGGERPTYAGPTVIHGPLVAGSGQLIDAMAKVIAGQRVR
jgi:myo-inositol-1(or 4)-monophosphatase